MPVTTDSGYIPDWLKALIGQAGSFDAGGNVATPSPMGLFSETPASPAPAVGLLSNNPTTPPPTFSQINPDSPIVGGTPQGQGQAIWGNIGPAGAAPTFTGVKPDAPMFGAGNSPDSPPPDVPLPPRRPNDLRDFQANTANSNVVGTEASGAPEVTAQQSPGLGDYLGKAGNLIGGIYGAGGPGDALIAMGLSNRTGGASIQALNAITAQRAATENKAYKDLLIGQAQNKLTAQKNFASSTFDYLTQKGTDPTVARAAVDAAANGQNELLNSLVKQNEGLDKWKATKDAYGNPIVYNENDPSKTMKIGGGAVGEDSGPGTANGLINKDNAHLKGDEFLATVPPELANRVRRINQGLEPLPVGGGFGAAKAANMQIADLVRQAYPEQDATVFKSRENTQKSFSGAGKDAQTISAFNSAISHGGLLAKAAEALDNGNVALFNNFRQQWATRTGQPLGDKVAYFNSVIDEFSKEMTRAYRGTGGAEADIKRELADLSPTLAPSQLRAKMLAKLDLLQSRMDSVQENWHNGMRDPGRELPDFPVISPHSQQVLDDIRKGSHTAAPSPNVAAAPAVPASPTSGAIPPPPKVGEIRFGMRYKGGPMKDPNSWEQP